MKHFSLTEEQQTVRDMAADLANSLLKVNAAKVDDAIYPVDNMKILIENGFCSCIIPEELGGVGLGYLAQIVVIEELARGCASTAAVVAASLVGADIIKNFAGDRLKEALLPGIMEGNLITYAANETEAGLPSNHISMRAVKTESGYILNGIKKNILNSNVGTGFIVVARDASDESLLAFYVPGDAVGISIAETPEKFGLKGCPMGDIVFENCAVENSLLISDDADKVLKRADKLSSLVMAAVAQGISKSAMEEAIQYVNVRVQFNKRIAQFLNTQGVLGELEAQMRASELLLWLAADELDNCIDNTTQVQAAKIFCCDLAYRVGRKSVQCFGGYGYTKDYPVERILRDAKMTELLCGTSRQMKYDVAHDIGVE